MKRKELANRLQVARLGIIDKLDKIGVLDGESPNPLEDELQAIMAVEQELTGPVKADWSAFSENPFKD